MVLLQRAVELRTTGDRRRRWIAPLTVGVFGAVFTALLSWIPSPWYDEAATVSAATRPLPDLARLLTNVDAVHGLYYLLMHVWFELVGYSPLTLRLPSAIATGIAAGLLVVLIRRLADRRTALVAGIVFCLLPRVTWMGTEGRSYALTALLAVALTLAFTLARQLPGGLIARMLLWLAYAAVAAIACTAFIYLALLVVAHGITVLLSRPQRRRDLLGWASASAAAGLAVLPLAIAESRQSAQVSWIAPLDATTWHQILVGQWFIGNDAFAVVGWALAITGTVLLVAASPRARPLLFTVLPWAIVPVAALLLVTAVGHPLYSARYLTFAAPAIAALIGVAIATPRRPLFVALALAACFGLTMPSYLAQRTPDAKQDSHWGDVAALIASERSTEPSGQRDAVIYGPLRKHPQATMQMLAVVYPQQFAGLVDLKAGQSADARGLLWAGRTPLAQTGDRLAGAPVIWLITSDKRDWRPGVTRQLLPWGYAPRQEWHFDGVNVVKYVEH